MKRRPLAGAALGLALGLWPAGPASAFNKDNGSCPGPACVEIVADSYDASAAGKLGDCTVGCVLGGVGGTAIASQKLVNGGTELGPGFFDLDYVFRRLMVLLPGEKLDPTSGTGKSGAPQQLISYIPFTVKVYATDQG